MVIFRLYCIMEKIFRFLFVLCCFKLVSSSETDQWCEIDLRCPDCLPDNMPLVTSHSAAHGQLRVPAGERLRLSCGAGAFIIYPHHAELTAVCEAAQYRLQHDHTLRHLLDLGCQENVFEDVLHHVDHCGAPWQGRAYEERSSAGAARHVATVCFDADRGIARAARVTSAPHNALSLAPHSDARGPLSLLGNFNEMFDARARRDAERLYSDDSRLNRRLLQRFEPLHVSFGAQTLTVGELLSAAYFEDQNLRVAAFPSNRIVVWSSVARGNLDHVQRDVAKLLEVSRPHESLDVYAGSHGVASLRVDHERTELYLKAGNMIPVPQYVWTVVHSTSRNKALAVVVLNDPFVTVHEARVAPCGGAGECGAVPWLHETRRAHRYEVPLYGLVFCCEVHNFSALFTEMSQEIIKNIPLGKDGLLYG